MRRVLARLARAVAQLSAGVDPVFALARDPIRDRSTDRRSRPEVTDAVHAVFVAPLPEQVDRVVPPADTGVPPS